MKCLNKILLALMFASLAACSEDPTNMRSATDQQEGDSKAEMSEEELLNAGYELVAASNDKPVGGCSGNGVAFDSACWYHNETNDQSCRAFCTAMGKELNIPIWQKGYRPAYCTELFNTMQRQWKSKPRPGRLFNYDHLYHYESKVRHVGITAQPYAGAGCMVHGSLGFDGYFITKRFDRGYNGALPNPDFVDGRVELACACGDIPPPQPPPPVPASRTHSGSIDVNADGKADVCGRSDQGVMCLTSNGDGFDPTPITTFIGRFGKVFSAEPSQWATLTYGDFDNDGKSDVAGRSPSGLLWTKLPGPDDPVEPGTGSIGSSFFANANGWDKNDYYWQTIKAPDVNGDGRSDICARGASGIYCVAKLGGSPIHFTPFFSNDSGFHASRSFWGTIQYADLNGDGKDDVCGRGVAGLFCGVSNGTAFKSIGLWSSFFGDVSGWGSHPSFWQTIKLVDVNGDRRADVCARGVIGIYCQLSTGFGFTPPVVWTTAFGNNNNWHKLESNWGTIQFVDVTGDGKADVCGRGHAGIMCGVSTGSAFGPVKVWSANYSDAGGWHSAESYWSTIKYLDLNGDGALDVCGRSVGGLICGVSNKSSFVNVKVWTTAFDDASGWGAQPHFWNTINGANFNASLAN